MEAGHVATRTALLHKVRNTPCDCHVCKLFASADWLPTGWGFSLSKAALGAIRVMSFGGCCFFQCTSLDCLAFCYPQAKERITFKNAQNASFMSERGRLAHECMLP